MSNMRAKMRVSNVDTGKYDGKITSERLTFNAVAKSDLPYPEDGSDENNTYARWSPSAELKIEVANPALFGKFQVGQQFYVDFTAAD